MKHHLLLIVITLSALVTGKTQVYLQLEKYGTLNTVRFIEGDILTFRLKNDDKGWNERPIASIDVKGNRLIFPDVVVPLDSIDAIRLDKKAVVSQIIGTALQSGGVSTMMFISYDAVFNDRPIEWKTFVSGAAGVAVGTLLKKMFKHRTFQISERKRLRLIDLYFSEPQKS